MSAEDIELAADWQGDEGAFVAALSGLRFLDGQDGEYMLHGWHEHNPWAAGAPMRQAKARWNATKRFYGEAEADRLVPEYAAIRNAASKADSTPLAQGQQSDSTAPTPNPTPNPNPTPTSEGEGPYDKPTLASKAKREMSPKLTFADWSDRVRAEGQKLITDAPVWEYAESINLPREFVEIAWYQFKNRYLTDPGYTKRKYADWRRTFRNSVEGNWFGIWCFNKAGEFQLTTEGEQASRALAAYEAALGAQGVVA